MHWRAQRVATYGKAHDIMASHAREIKNNRPDAQWYTHARWRRRRVQQLQGQPLCGWCHDRGYIVAATVVHHVEPHRGDRMKFWNGPLVSLCKRCHDSDAQSLERTGRRKRTIGADGWPIE